MSKKAFFRQSGWMIFATIACGAMMWLVHFLSKKIPDGEYGTLSKLLAATIIIPALPLQMVFARETAAALATGRERQLAGMIRQAWLGSFLLWLAGAAVVLAFQQTIVARWQLANPAALHVALLVALGCIWMPLFSGVVQGAQNFLWLGWAAILNGAGRVVTAALIVFLLGGYAAGIMTGAALGYGVATGVCLWQARRLWLASAEPFAWGALLRQVVPLMLGFGACQFLFSADTIFVGIYFTPEDTAYYGGAGTLSRALVWVVGPLTAVMFPKIVHSVAKAEKTDLLGVTLLGTAILAGGGAVALCGLASWIVPFVFKPSFVTVALKVLPWYAGAMVPLSLANVLVNNLLARSQFGVVPWLVGLAGAYAFALTRFHGSLIAVLQTLAIFCLLTLAVCAWFTWGGKRNAADGK